MESSSDDSFAWTNASSDTADSDIMNSHNTIKNQSDVESEFGSSYKKKLHKKLFSNNEENHVTEESTKKKKKKRKSKSEQSDEECIESPKKKRIKVEPESDLESTKINGSHYTKYDNERHPTPIDESYLNMRVKEEEKFATPSPVKSKKKRHKSDCDMSTHSNNESESDNINSNNNKVSAYQTNGDVGDISHPIDSEETQIKVKKKKKKSKRRRSSSENHESDDKTLILDKFSAEETVVDTHQVNGKSKRVSKDARKKDKLLGNQQEHVNNTDSKVSSRDESTKIKDEKRENFSSKLIVDDNSDVEATGNMSAIVGSPKTLDLSNSHILKKSKQSVSKISSRITFEHDHDDDDDDLNITENNERENVKNSRKVKNFLKGHPDLKPVMQGLPYGTILTEDDEIWAIKCPHDINVDSFQGLNFNLDKKSKIKIGEQTYESNINEESGRIPVLSLMQKDLVIKNLPLNGTLNLRKRIPKAHVPDYSIIMNNETDFIPLPETKCRHPLFGSHYKRAMKIPKAIAERLNAEAIEPSHTQSEQTKKKKHKKDKSKTEDATSEPMMEPKYEIEHEEYSESAENTKKKKSRKRKHDHQEESPPSKKSKKQKHEQGATEVWESEKAIEESLFNF